jgi:hypothetical protein
MTTFEIAERHGMKLHWIGGDKYNLVLNDEWQVVKITGSDRFIREVIKKHREI